MPWDLFCRVVDNYGDAGVCWRLATGLAARGQAVRLWIDDTAPLAWMAPGGCAGVQVAPFEAAAASEPGAVVIEAFGCDPPPAFVARMAAQAQPPAWINLEYLSAEPWVERCHRLRSPQQAGPGAGLDKWFFYPGFTAATGGLLRSAASAAPPPDPRAWLAAQGWALAPDERAVLLFCYDPPGLAEMLQRLARQAPTALLVPEGPALPRLAAHRAAGALPAGLRVQPLPRLDQARFDTLLHCTDLNLVRGEDSFVQAQWCGTPFVWQAYVQHDHAHAVKVEAFLSHLLPAIPATSRTAVARLWRAWNDIGPWPEALPEHTAWRQGCVHWRDTLLDQAALVDRLLIFVSGLAGQRS